MAFSFSVAFSSIFVYLHGSYTISTLTALAVAGPLAAVTGLGVTFSIFFRYELFGLNVFSSGWSSLFN